MVVKGLLKVRRGLLATNGANTAPSDGSAEHRDSDGAEGDPCELVSIPVGVKLLHGMDDEGLAHLQTMDFKKMVVRAQLRVRGCMPLWLVSRSGYEEQLECTKPVPPCPAGIAAGLGCMM